jgi:hypothetical protein
MLWFVLENTLLHIPLQIEILKDINTIWIIFKAACLQISQIISRKSTLEKIEIGGKKILRKKIFIIQVIIHMLYAINDWFWSIYHHIPTVLLTQWGLILHILIFIW